MTEAEADKRADGLEARITEMVNRTHDRDRDREGKAGPRHAFKANLAVAAKALGMSEAEVRTGLVSGQSLAQIAEANEVDVNALIKALVDDATTRLAAKVAAGEITQAQADQRSLKLDKHITAIVTRTKAPPSGL